MKNFLLNWNYKKQLAAEVMGYGCIAMIGNAWLGKKSTEKEKTLCPQKAIKQMPKKQKCFNGLLISCFITDVTASYFLLRYLQNKIR
ncbi:MAG: hypothetical protein ACOX4P_05570 [Anaerovoracaceae bacterium]|jgi:hypothetical protein